MRYPHLTTRLYGTPLLIHPDKAAVIEAVFRAHAEGMTAPRFDFEPPKPEAAAYASPRFADKPYTLTEGGVAVLPVIGSLLQRAGGFDFMSGMTGYNRIERLLNVAMADRDVRAILLELDSPGGEANGVFDLAEQIRAAVGTKPIWASANEAAYSAAYAIGSAAQRLVIPRTGGIGSIGVIALHVDQSKRDAAMGYDYTAIYAGARKNDGNPHEPLSDEARDRLQAEVNRLYDAFVGHVATMRGMDGAKVRATEAGVFAAPDAVEIGLADAVQSFNDTISELEAHVRPSGFSTQGHYAHRMEGHMTDLQKPQAEGQSAAPAETSEQAYARGHAEGLKAGATAERTRVSAIQSSEEAKGREKLAAHIAFNTGMSADEARAMLAAAPIESAAAAPVNPLAAAMAGVPNAKVGAAAGDENDTAEAEASKIVALHRGLTK